MTRSKLRALLDAPSDLMLRMMTVIALVITCVLALTGSPRLIWMVLTSLALILLTALNRIRISVRVRRMQGTARRKRRRHRQETSNTQH